MRMFAILRVVTKILLPHIILFALYVQFHGDFGPGGGFQAGVIFAAGVILFSLVFGLSAARRVISPVAVEVMIALGVLIYAGTGLATIALGGKFLDYNVLDRDFPDDDDIKTRHHQENHDPVVVEPKHLLHHAARSLPAKA